MAKPIILDDFVSNAFSRDAIPSSVALPSSGTSTGIVQDGSKATLESDSSLPRVQLGLSLNFANASTQLEKLMSLSPSNEPASTIPSSNNSLFSTTDNALASSFAASMSAADSAFDSSVNALTSILMLQSSGSKQPGSQVHTYALTKGTLSIDCTTTLANGNNPEQILAAGDKLNPGWLSNVNWSDDDNDGWNPASTKTSTADPTAIYTPDRDDTLVAGGDPDLRKFVVTIINVLNVPNPNYAFTLTWSNSVKLYYKQDKPERLVMPRPSHHLSSLPC